MGVRTHVNMAPDWVPGVQPVTGTTVFFENPGAVGAYLNMSGAVVRFVVPGVTGGVQFADVCCGVLPLSEHGRPK